MNVLYKKAAGLLCTDKLIQWWGSECVEMCWKENREGRRWENNEKNTERENILCRGSQDKSNYFSDNKHVSHLGDLSGKRSYNQNT